jgi:hypothetical protein
MQLFMFCAQAVMIVQCVVGGVKDGIWEFLGTCPLDAVTFTIRTLELVPRTGWLAPGRQGSSAIVGNVSDGKETVNKKTGPSR